jgi:hypothetical protein
MATYSVHLPRDATSAGAVAEGAVFVKEGFTFFAFVFTGLWLLIKGLWLPLIAFVAVNMALAAALAWAALPPVVLPVLNLLIALYIGMEAPGMQRAKLKAKGFAEAGTVVGKTLDECERRFFESWLDGNRRAPPPLVAASTSPVTAPRTGAVLGLFPTPAAGARPNP